MSRVSFVAFFLVAVLTPQWVWAAQSVAKNCPKCRAEREQEAALHISHARQMPAPATVATLDDTTLDQVLAAMKLSLHQREEIEAARRSVFKHGLKLLDDQDRARSNYREPTESDCEKRKTKVEAAAAACKAFIPDEELAKELSDILTAAQLNEYGTLKAKPQVPEKK